MQQVMHNREREGSIRPGGWVETWLLFGIPGAMFLLAFEWKNPWLQANGVPLVWSFTILLYVPLLMLGLVAWIAYRREGNPPIWVVFRDRMRLQPMTGKTWLWAIAGVIVALLLEALLEPTRVLLASIPLLSPPPMLPALIDPAQPIVIPPTDYLGVPLAGSYWVIGLYAFSLFANIICEELLWRGYLLPRQERVFGRWAWLVNGLLWIFVFHAMFRWMWITLLPTGLITPFVAQRTGSTWAAILIHGVGNAVFLVLIVIGVFTG
jgi:hypothetical protein